VAAYQPMIISRSAAIPSHSCRPATRAIMAGIVDPCRPEVCLSLLLLTADDGGVLGGYAVQVQVELARPLDRAPRVRERLGGPQRKESCGDLGAGRGQPPAAPPRCSDAYEGDGGASCDGRCHDREHVNEFGHGGLPVRVVPAAVCAAARRRPVGSGKEGMADEAPL
jgi:hypothetical protein